LGSNRLAASRPRSALAPRASTADAAPGAARLPTYASLIASALHRWPDRVAFVRDSSSTTYREQLETTCRLQDGLTAAGVGRGDGVAVLSRHTAEAFAAAAATICAGGRYVPINPGYSLDDAVHAIGDARASTLLFDPGAFGELASKIAARNGGLERVLSLGPCSDARDVLASAAARTPGALRVDAEPEDVGVILYTGGSTGRPKGVALSQATLALSALAMLAEWEWPAEIRLLAITQMAQGLIVPTLLRGGSVVLQDAFDPGAVADGVERHRVTVTFLVPAMMYALLDHLPESARLDPVETAFYGNSPITPDRARAAVERFGPIFMQEYSLSEATPACILRREEHLDATLLASCGRPIGGTEVELRDDEGARVDQGAVGELCLRGPTVMSGYWGQPELTEQALGDGWLRTGDLAYEGDRGFLYLVDRKKDMIISSGVNVYSREVEDVLCGIDGVGAAAVIGIPDEVAGEALHATVVPRSGAQLDVLRLQAAVAEAKGSQRVPRDIEFAAVLPMTAHGKPDKRALRAPHWSGEKRGIH